LLGFLETCCSLAFGTYAIYDDGVMAGHTFSWTLAATRNPAFDRAVLAEEQNPSGTGGELLQRQIIYGYLVAEEKIEQSRIARMGLGRKAFGFEGQIIRLRRGF